MKLAKEIDVDPGGSLTRLATELYVDLRLGDPSDSPIQIFTLAELPEANTLPDETLVFVSDASTEGLEKFAISDVASNSYRKLKEGTRNFFAPVVTDGLILDLNAESLSLANNTGINLWADDSGEGNDAVNTSGNPALYPVYRDNIYPFPVVRFGQGGQAAHLDTPIVKNSGELTIMTSYACHNPGNLPGSPQRLIAGSNNYIIGPWTGRYTFFTGGSGWVATGGQGSEPAVVDDEFVVQTAMQDVSQADHYLNGDVVGENITPGGFPGTIYLGARGPFVEPPNVDVRRLLIWDRLLTTVERLQVEAALSI